MRGPIPAAFVVLCAFVSAAPLAVSAPADVAFTATFKVPLGTVNEWWVEVKVTGDRPIHAVSAIVNERAPVALTKQSNTEWAKSLYVRGGSQVRFVAFDADGNKAESKTFAWPSKVLPAERVVESTVVLDGLFGPVDFALAPNGDIWWNEYHTGDVTRHDPDDGSRTVMFHADTLDDPRERGMVGLALDPNVVENGVFYVYYTVADPEDPSGGTNRLSRIEDGAETVLLTASAYLYHNSGRIVFAPDGSMFVAVGDNNRGMVAQDPLSRLGKILHLLPTGEPAPGNIAGYVYDLGHRNVYGLAYDEATDRLFATENGHRERDEINLIEAGKNYGWPLCEGSVAYDFQGGMPNGEPLDEPCGAEFTPPLGEFYENRTTAPTGAAILRGELYWASWNHGSIHRLREGANGTWTDEVVAETGGPIADLEAGRKGASLYYSNWTSIMRLDLFGPPPSDDDGGPAPGGDGGGAPAAAPALVAAAALLAVLARSHRRRT